MVGSDSAEYACLYILPHFLYCLFGLQDGRAFKERSVLDHIFVSEGQIMSTGLCRDIIAFILGGFDLLCNRRMGYMADMSLASCGLRKLNDRVCRHDLRNYRTGLQISLPVIASGLFHSLFLILDDGVVFTMEACTSVKLFDNVHRFQRLAVA